MNPIRRPLSVVESVVFCATPDADWRTRLPASARAWYFPVVNRSRSVEATRADDAALLSRLARGDRDALAALYDAYSSAVFGVVRRIVRTATEAEDICHDVFVEAWRRAADYDPARGSVRTWLVLRARSRALDHVKSAAVSRTDALTELVRSDDSPDSAMARASDGARVVSALSALPEEQRAVLLLGYFQGLSSTEIAEVMGTPVGTVKSRVASALGRLRKLLAEPVKEGAT